VFTGNSAVKTFLGSKRFGLFYIGQMGLKSDRKGGTGGTKEKACAPILQRTLLPSSAYLNLLKPSGNFTYHQV
jgi:hypothetical protein